MTTILIRVSMLKRKAANAYRLYQQCTAEMDCGNALTQHISATASRAARDFDEAMAELKQVDPNCPDYTPLTRV